jgi:3-oxoacyl-[acyl-carrier protein] reductase
MDLGLKGKVAFVAGASRGLGKAVALELVREGVKVAICARNQSELAGTVEDIKESTGGEIIGIQADVSIAADAKGFIRRGIEHFGSADILVNNAGGPPSRAFLEIDDELWIQGFQLNLLSTIIMTREIVPVLKEKQWGRIINITSVAVKQPLDGLILSNTVRAGVIGLAKSLSNELAPFNITVNNVCPGYTMTERVSSLAAAVAEKEGSTPEAVITRWTSSIPMGRIGSVEEFSALVAFLASERAGYITGTAIQVDGGYYKGIM